MALNTVKNPLDEVFKIWKSKVGKFIGDDNCSVGGSSQIAQAPFCKLTMMPSGNSSYDLQGDEIASRISFQVESYADGVYAIGDAYDIDSASHQAMTDMLFRRTYGPELIENAEVRIKRVVSRYTRIYTEEPFPKDE